MASRTNKFVREPAAPPQVFLGEKEKNLVKQQTDEIIERVIGQQIVYFPISIQHSNFNLYGESIEKTFLPPIHVYALVEWEGLITETSNFGIDRRNSITVRFHKRRLTEDQDLFIRVGDFLQYGDIFYEIVSLDEPQQLFGKPDNRYEITAKCVRARDGKFNAE